MTTIRVNENIAVSNEDIDRSAAFLIHHGGIPEVGLILGSGMSAAADRLDVSCVIPFDDIPGFEIPRVQTHVGEVVFGMIGNKLIATLKGRIHCYEGHTLSKIAFPVFVLARMGIKLLVTTNLVGGINRNLRKGDFVLIKDHINLVWDNPLVGLNPRNVDTLFVDMFDAYSPAWRKKAHQSANRLGMTIHDGVLAFVVGPNFETRSELRFLRMIGADVVSWSMVPEVIAARYKGIDVVGISCVSDISDPDSLEPLNLEAVFNIGKARSDQLYDLVREVLI